ncbi:MAG: heavy metal sensor histidine kinase [Burkholderiaceae bacterium]
MRATSGQTPSIATRLALMLALVALGVFSSVGTLLHLSLERELLDAERLELEGKAGVVQHFIDEVHSPADLSNLRHHLDDALIGNETLRVWIIGAGGRVLYGGARAPSTRPGQDGRLSIMREDGIALTGLRYTLRTGSVMPDAHVLVGLDTRARQALMRTYDHATILVCALGVTMTILLGIWVTGRGLRPIRRLSDEAAGIAPGALSRRLSIQHDSRELAPLVRSFNHALDRLEDAYRHLEDFSANVAHELRTPLTVLISGTEVALSRDRTVEELQELLVSNLEEVRGLASMVNDMLFLAQADRDQRAEGLVALSLRNEALTVADYLEAALEESHHSLEVQGDVRAHGNPSLVRRALLNLVTNAALHTPANATILVRLDKEIDTPRVSVCNPGLPISDEVCARMFDRFWRGDASRARPSSGYGLGLAIVRAVARMHGGETFANSQAGVTTIGFTLGSS